MGKKVAVVGSGCSGIGAVWALQSTEHEVHLFEAASRLGGHTNTVVFEGINGRKTNVDTGFIVMNTATYPNFIHFLEHLGVPMLDTDMTFGVSRDGGLFEWAGTSLSSIFAQKWNIFRPRMWRLIYDIVRFNEFAVDILRDADESANDPVNGKNARQSNRMVEESVGEYLDRNGYSQTFKDDYLLPMTASVWSTSPDKCSLEFPAVTLVRFLWNHHLLNTITQRPTWRTIPGGTQQYISRALEAFPKDNIHLNAKVTQAAPTIDGRVVLTINDENQHFDHVILATHGDEALEILKPVATREELNILDGFKTNRNVAVLHSDTSLMPKRRITWSAWNYMTESPFPPTESSNISKVCLTYWMNPLQHIPEHKYGPIFVTLNPLKMPHPHLCQGVWEYAHPSYNAAAIRSQKMLPRIQNTRGISYCGAWTKYGFHEDGFSSGLSAAINHLGAELPFSFIDSTFSRGRKPELTWQNYLVRICLLCVQITILLILRLWNSFEHLLDESIARRRKVV